MEPADCLAFNLRRAARAVSRAYDHALAPVGLKNTQFSLLSALTALGPSPITRLAEVLVMERTTLTRNLRPLERDGLIALEPGEDRRQRIVALTRSGRVLMDRALPLWRAAHTEVRGELSDSRGERLLRDLRKVASTFG